MRIQIILLFLLIAASSLAAPLTIDTDNPRYVSDDSGNAIYLTGSHNWGVLTDDDDGVTDVGAIEFLDYMASHNQNFIRLWVSSRAWTDGGTVHDTPIIFQRTGGSSATDGLPKFDLTKYDSAYTDALRNFIEEASNRGIYVSIMLFEGWWNAAGGTTRANAWDGNPYNPLNNINSLGATTATIHTLDNSNVVAMQEAYVRNIIDAVNEYDNIIFEICNEDGEGSTEWQIYHMDKIRGYEATKPKQHLVWISTQAFRDPPATPNDDWIWGSSADMISPGRSVPYSQRMTDPLVLNPPVTDGSKIVILDTDHFVGDTVIFWRDLIWKLFFRGYNPIVMDPNYYHPSWTLDPNVISATDYTNYLAKKIDLDEMIPSSNPSDCSTTYCLRNPGQEYLVYQPNQASFSVNLVAGDYDYEWYDALNGVTVQTGTVTANGGSQSFSIPSSIHNDSVLYLKSSTEGPINDGWLDKSSWSVLYVDSEETDAVDNTAELAFDDNLNTFWHTQYYNADQVHPHEIQIDLGDYYSMTMLQYYPRIDSYENGNIKDYELYVSMDANNWQLVSYGSLEINQAVNFNGVGKYIRLVALNEWNGNPWTSAAEISVFGAPVVCSDVGSCCSGACTGTTFDIGGCTCCVGTCDSSTCDGLVLYMNFDDISEIGESTSSIHDFTGNSNTRHSIGAQPSSDGKYYNGYVFDGKDDYLQIDHNPSLDITGTAITAAAWVKIGDQSDDVGIITKGSVMNDESYMLGIEGSEKPRMRIVNGAFVQAVSPDPITLGEWHFIVGTYDGSNIKIYVDGELKKTEVQTGSLQSTTAPVVIGRRVIGDDRFYNGTMDEIAVWNRVLSAQEIMEINNTQMDCGPIISPR